MTQGVAKGGRPSSLNVARSLAIGRDGMDGFTSLRRGCAPLQRLAASQSAARAPVGQFSMWTATALSASGLALAMTTRRAQSACGLPFAMRTGHAQSASVLKLAMRTGHAQPAFVFLFAMCTNRARGHGCRSAQCSWKLEPSLRSSGKCSTRQTSKHSTAQKSQVSAVEHPQNAFRVGTTAEA